MRRQRPSIVIPLLGLLAAVALSAPLAAEEFPYGAVTAREGVLLRCGPGDSYYATSRLPQGTKVEVYQQTPDGWCAIRPLAECFSLIPSTQTRLADGASLAEVTTDKAVSWIGTELDSDQQLLWQVQLKQGETVEIVGIVRRDSLTGEGKDPWYKIRPPAGEFRYLHRDDLTRSDTAAPAGQMEFTPLERAPIQVASHLESQASAEQPAAPESQWRVQTNPRARLEQDRDSQPITIAPRNSPGVATDSAVAVEPRQPDRKALAGDPEAILNAFDVKLSLLAAQPVADWDFAEFQQQLALLEQMDTTTRQRTRMVRFRQRLQDFVDLRAKQEQLTNSSSEPIAAPRAPAPLIPSEQPLITEIERPVGTGLANQSVEQEEPIESLPAEYDGMGYLMPVISREQQAPPFALLDKNGKVLGFVSPVPGLNLRRYLKQEVGVIGQRGYLPKYQATHLTAQRIIVLDRHR